MEIVTEANEKGLQRRSCHVSLFSGCGCPAPNNSYLKNVKGVKNLVAKLAPYIYHRVCRFKYLIGFSLILRSS